MIPIFNVADPVWHIDGTPMAVEAIESHTRIRCVWDDETGIPHRVIFPLEELRKTAPLEIMA